MVETIINAIIDFACGLADVIMFLLPMSPFSALELAFDNQLLRHINYFLPVGEALNILTAWGIAILGWYLYSLILRWVKAVR